MPTPSLKCYLLNGNSNTNKDLKKISYARASFTKGIQTSPFEHHLVLRSNEERESAINVFLPPLLSVRQRVSASVRPRSLAAVMLDGERASQPCKHAKSGRVRLPERMEREEHYTTSVSCDSRSSKAYE